MLPPRREGLRTIQVSDSLWKEMTYEMERLDELGVFLKGWSSPEVFLVVLFNHWLQKPPGGSELRDLFGLHPGKGRPSWTR
jgi:hypothetical protein